MKNTQLFFTFFPMLLFICSCQIDRTTPIISEKDHYRIKGFQAMKPQNKLKLAADGEPGQRLIICGKLIRKDNKTVLKNQPMQIYHTDLNGDYNPSNTDDESTARLSGNVETNDLGMFYLETILPGNYGSSADNRHIHTTVFGAKPEAYDLHFKQYSSFMGNRFINKSDQHFLVDLLMNTDSTLVGFVTMEIKGKD